MDQNLVIMKFIKNLYNKTSELIRELFKDSKLKIAVLTPSYGFDGQGNVIDWQVRDLKDNGYEVSIFTLESDRDAPAGVDLHVIGAPRNSILKLIYHLLLPLWFNKIIKFVPKLKEYDLIICHHNSVAWLAYFAKKLWNKPYIFHCHTINPPYVFKKFTHKIYNYINHLIYNFLVKNSDYTISISYFVKKIIFENTNKESFVIYNKIFKNKFLSIENKNKIRGKYNIKESDYVILFVGRLTYHKGVDLLIKAFRIVKQKIPNSKLIIVGSPQTMDYLIELYKLADNNVIFAGFVPDDELPYYYAICDVYATCSLYEGFNLPLVEAQLAGKPVIAFDIGPHKEIVKSGYLVEPLNIDEFAEKLINLLMKVSLPKERRKIARRCLKSCQKLIE